MSIFKIKQWWSNEKLLDEKHDEGSQSSNNLKVDRFDLHKDCDSIIVGQGSVIKIYKPSIEQNASDIILETDLNEIILQIGTGKFTM